jgi:outer membrane protein assembly factor BamB
MQRQMKIGLLLLCYFASTTSPVNAQKNSDWRISPEKINIMVGNQRRLQVLDDVAQELHGAVWAVDDPSLADLREEEGHVELEAKDVGTVRVSASIGNETRTLEIKIWPVTIQLPEGTTNWSMHPIGRDVGDIPAVPTVDGPEVFSLEQTPSGTTILRAVEKDGMQMWTWVMPEKTSDLELVCGDWLGGVVISANRADSYTLYVVGKDGSLRWNHDSPGARKALAISTDHLTYLLSQSRDATSASLAVFDEADGTEKFELQIPASRENLTGLRLEGTTYMCSAGSKSIPAPAAVSRVYVNMDGFAYLAFSQSERTIGTDNCVPGAVVNSAQSRLTRREDIYLWQIHRHGMYRATVVESARREQPLSDPLDTFSPAHSILTDNMNGTLVPVQVTHSNGTPSDDLEYRVDADGNVVYKFPFPKYSGPLRDDMVIGMNDTGFATRGGTLIAFNVRTGKELWRWDSHAAEITVFAALADGGCAVQTPTHLIEVIDGVEAREIMKGKAMMSWNGQMYRKVE